jgi:hypothetical protein
MVWAIVSRTFPKRRDRRRPDHPWKIVAETVHAWCRRPSRLSCQPRRTSAATDIRNFLKQRRVRLPSVDFAAADLRTPTGGCLMVRPSFNGINRNRLSALRPAWIRAGNSAARRAGLLAMPACSPRAPRAANNPITHCGSDQCRWCAVSPEGSEQTDAQASARASGADNDLDMDVFVL